MTVPGRRLAYVVVVAAAMAVLAATPGEAGSMHSMTPAQYDVHLKLSASAEAAAQELNSRVTELCPHNGVDLNVSAQPHITLYLTEFTPAAVPTALTGNVSAMAPVLVRCNVTMGELFVQGSYGMWAVEDSTCLQADADVAAALLVPLAVPNQPVPGWVSGLPPAERAQKTAMVQRFGSPNVFMQFQPHVTIAFDDSPDDDLAACVAQLHAPATVFEATTIAVGTTGPHGTVLRGKDLGDYAIGTPSSVAAA
mmetsp:Transcript_15227/g.52900  ORF Transcript_15227/g.52900 Transcript_15227/m.52900 type:complete len:252 (-) Transcript_15227:34-789(-)